ncbi:MAG: hypothetical protein AB1791_15295 [Chloroflexota bacterium]
MSFNWSSYADLAYWLLDNAAVTHNVEAACRSAVSRAYYAAYHAAVETAQAKDNFIPAQTSDDHREIIEHFLYSLDPTYQRIGAELQRLRRDRNKADYDDVLRERPGTMATRSLYTAKTLLVTLTSL